jgi:hypothetical protein
LLGLPAAARLGGGSDALLAAPEDRRACLRSALRSRPSSTVILGGALVPHPAREALAHPKLHAGDGAHAHTNEAAAAKIAPRRIGRRRGGLPRTTLGMPRALAAARSR